jgi:membrane protein DedA with SNARE-associated domain
LPTCLGCGWFGVPFPRFAVAAAIAAATYVPLMFTLVTLFGTVVLRRLSAWSWLPLAVIVVIGVFVANRARTRRGVPSRSRE